MTEIPSAPGFGVRATAARAAAILLAAMLMGCHTSRQAVVFDYPNDVRQRHPIAITEGERTMNVFVGVHRGGLNPAQRAGVFSLAHAWRREATGGIVIDVPAGTANERAAADAVDEIRSILAAAGVPPHAVAARPYRPVSPAKLATVKIKYPKMVAQAGPCGLWPRDIGPTYDPIYNENREHWNFGCANQRNLAAMVDDPADLVQPREETPIYAARRSTVLEKFRRGEYTGTVLPDANKGKVSDIGQ